LHAWPPELAAPEADHEYTEGVPRAPFLLRAGSIDVGSEAAPNGGDTGTSPVPLQELSFWPPPAPGPPPPPRVDSAEGTQNVQASNLALRLPLFLEKHSASCPVDSGAEHNCVDQASLERLRPPSVRLADGSVKHSGFQSTAHMACADHADRADFVVMDLDGEDLILGMPWLHRLNLTVSWRARSLTFFHRGMSHTLRAWPPRTAVPIISAASAVKALRQGEICPYLALG